MGGSQCEAEAVDVRTDGIELVAKCVEQRHGVADEPPLDRQLGSHRRKRPALVRAEQAAPAHFASAQLGHRVRAPSRKDHPRQLQRLQRERGGSGDRCDHSEQRVHLTIRTRRELARLSASMALD